MSDWHGCRGLVWLFTMLLIPLALGADQWRQTLDRAALLHGQGSLVEAVLVAEQAAKEARSAGASEGDVEMVEFQQSLFEIDAGRFPQAAAHIEPIFRQREVRLGPKHPKTLLAKVYLGQSFAMMGDIDRGLSFLGPASKEMMEVMGPDAPEVWAARASFGIALADAGAFERADKALSSVVSHARKQSPRDDGFVSGLIGHLAMAKAMRNEPKKAERLVREAIEMRTNAGLLEHPRTIPLYMTLGQIELVLRRPESALVVLERGRTLARKFWTPDHPELTSLYASLGLARLRTGDVRGAEEPLRKALALTEATLGPSHPTAGAILAMLAEFMERQNRSEEARQLQTRSREIMTNTNNTVSVWSLRDAR